MKYKLHGDFKRFDTSKVNCMGRVYPEHILKKETRKYERLIRKSKRRDFISKIRKVVNRLYNI